MSSSYSTVENVFYSENFGCSMGSLISPIVILDELEPSVLFKIPINVPVYYTLAADIFGMVHEGHHHIGNFNNRLQFTLEISTRNIMIFLVAK